MQLESDLSVNIEDFTAVLQQAQEIIKQLSETCSVFSKNNKILSERMQELSKYLPINSEFDELDWEDPWNTKRKEN